MGGMPLTKASKAWLSCRLAPETATELGRPLPSQIRWIFDPFLPLSVGVGPVGGPP